MNKHSYVTLSLALLLSACGGAESTGNGTDSATKAEAAPLPIGTIGKAEGVEFTVTEVSATGEIGPAGVGAKAEKGETFVVASYTIKNTAGEALSLMDRPGVTLVDGKGRSYSPDEMASAMAGGMMDDPSGMAADLNPNVSAKSKIAWKVDEGAFDKGTWKLVVGSDPKLTYALK